MAVTLAKRVRAKRVATLVAKGTPYRVIADEIGADCKEESKRQRVYNLVQTPAVQQELRRIEKQMNEKYTAEDCLRELDEALAIAREKNQALALIQGALGKAKVAGLLIDKVQDVTEPVDKEQLDKQAAETLSTLSVSAEGIETEGQKVT